MNIRTLPQTDQRTLLSQLLRSCRARLQPEDVGLPATGRRRTPGLRREEVALLAGISVSWYTWLEQGREVDVSAAVLESVAATLRLSADEREYLFALAQNRPPPLQPGRAEPVPGAVQRMLDALSVPAVIITLRWDVVAWNTLATRVFRDYDTLPENGRNLVQLVLTSPEYREDPVEYEKTARRLLAKLRADYSQAIGDPAFEALIEQLTEACPIFSELWNSSEIRGRVEGMHSIRHPMLGTLTFEHTSYVVEGVPTLRVVAYTPVDEVTATALPKVASGEVPPRAQAAAMAAADASRATD